MNQKDTDYELLQRLNENYRTTLTNLGCTFRIHGEHVGTVLTTPYITPPDVEAALIEEAHINAQIEVWHEALHMAVGHGNPEDFIREYIEKRIKTLEDKKKLFI